MRAHLSAEHLAKAYKGRSIVNDVSLEIQAGEIVGLLGPNGAGKTTCFLYDLGVGQCRCGPYFLLNGKDITANPIHQRARAGLGYLPQEASIFRQLSVRDNVLAILETRSDLNKKDRTFLCAELLEEF